MRRRRRILVIGGSRSGKSRYAEQLLGRARAVTYVACGDVPDGSDPEWGARIALHRGRRPAHWETVETRDLTGLLATAGPPLLVDCLSTWLAGAMDECGVWRPETADDAALARRIDDLVAAWTTSRRRVVSVSSEVGSGVVPATAAGRRFRDELGSLNARIAAASDRVVLVVAGLPVRLR